MANRNQARRHAIENHIRRIEKRLQKLEADRNRFARYRPLVFFAGVALTYWTGWTSLIIAALVMSIEALYYHRVGKVIHKHQIWLNIKSVQLARMTLDWDNIHEPPSKAPDENHPFEIDLDLTGRRSLHHLIDMAVSHEGSQRLREWFLQTHPNPKKIETRQQIVRELVPLARFRDKLLLNFRLVSREYLDSKKLLRWLQGQSSSSTPLRKILPLSIGLAAVNITLFSGYQLKWIPGYWVISFALYLVVYFMNFSSIAKSFEAVIVLRDELDKFKTILRYLETYPYSKNVHLKQLCEPFCNSEYLPSRQLRKIAWLTTAVAWRMNPMLALLLNMIIPWDMYFARLIEHHKVQCSQHFPKWINAWAELEALVSLANFAYLHPDYVFPEILSSDSTFEGGQGDVYPSQPIFQAIGLGHPLIPPEQKVCNDFRIQSLREITLLTGSNMSGKSTFLKTVGISLCLAYAGGPVNAVMFQTRLFRIFTCIRINDSITDGFSFFYAEVKRLKTLLEVLDGEDPIVLMFLIDEIFKGTNSRERLIGSRAYIHHLSNLRGVGMIATHDLELGQLEEQIPGLSNMHFRDDVADGKMVFDYKLHSGLCPTTNALKIMRMEGLPVEISC